MDIIQVATGALKLLLSVYLILECGYTSSIHTFYMAHVHTRRGQGADRRNVPHMGPVAHDDHNLASGQTLEVVPCRGNPSGGRVEAVQRSIVL